VSAVTEKDKKSHIFSEFDSTPPAEDEVSDGEGAEGLQASTGKTQEFDLLNDKYLRLAAEFENYKRRVQKDQQEAARFANERILKELLPIIDNLERAVQSARDGGSHEGLTRGVELTLKQFSEMLHRFGVRQMASVGKKFDPAYHQAVARIESKTIPEDHIAEEHQKGYLLNDRILRPAMVTVAGRPPGDGARESDGAEAPGDF
jgi:molecular chaperone GrpE